MELKYIVLKLSICDIIVGQKSSNGDEKKHFFGQEYDNLLNI